MPDIEIDTDFPEQLKMLRHAAGWTQEDLASNLGVSRQTISAVENGKKEPPIALYIAIIGLFLAGCLLSPYIRGIMSELKLGEKLGELFKKA